MANFERDKSGKRLILGGIDLVHPVDLMPPNKSPFIQNCRAYVKGGIVGRNLLTDALFTVGGSSPNAIRRLNDSTPNGPSSGYSLMIGNGTELTAWNSTIGVVNVASGLSSNPLSMVPFRPNTSVQPWMYIGDSAEQGNVTLTTEYCGENNLGPAGTPVSFVSNGMMKVSCNEGYTDTPTPSAVCYKMGVKEPQLAPSVSTENTGAPFGVGASGNLLATAIPWTNYASANSGYSYGETDAYHGQPGGVAPFDGTAPFIVNVLNASTITVTSLTGSATVNVGTHSPTDTSSTWVGGTYPGQFIRIEGTGGTPTTASVVLGAFTDGSGNVIDMGVAPIYASSVVDVGSLVGTAIRVPSGAVDFQIGINSAGNTYSSNSGAFTIVGTVITNSLPSVTSTLGTLTAYYWGDSPISGPTSAYIWKNPEDSGGSGPTRSTSDAVGSTTGNSFIFDCSFPGSPTPGIPELPGIGDSTLPMEWTTLTSDSVASGEYPVFSPAIKGKDGNTAYQNFNFCLVGSIYYPSAGQYTHVLTSHDDCIWGIGDGVTLVSATVSGSGEGSSTSISGYGQTITVVGGYPLLPRQKYTHGDGGNYARTTVVVNVPAAGIYPIEIDYDYWYHSGRILLLMVSPTPGASATIVPPLSSNVRQQVQYRYVYRSSATGAVSNPSPESTAQSVPVTANTVTSLWSSDPQVDVVDYYRIDSTTSSFTYVNTGPNDNSGTGSLAGTNTPVTDSLRDTQLGTQLLDYDNFEPFPSIDLPQKGVCSVSGEVITWISGGAIGGSATGFNPRWLAGTNILIGSPTALAYTLIARPTPAGFENAYSYPLGFVILNSSNHYQKVTTAGTSQSIGTPTWNNSGGTTTSGGAVFADQGTVFIGNGFVTQITIPGVPDGTNVAYEIEEPILAAQPLPYMWGPTDNVNFVFAVGDSLRPGTLYWCKGSNLDSAPDTNQLDVTDPGEPLIDGAISGGVGCVFSINRAWLIIPNYATATASATGTSGSTWTLQESSISRGLYMPRCVCVSGGGNIFFRVTDGIHVSSYGSASKSVTDEDLYPLFPHESEDGGISIPQPVTIAGYTIYPPDDSRPESQKMYSIGAYVYYDFVGSDGVEHTLVFDEAAMGWVYDLYTPPVTVHAANDGQSVQGVLVGCNDGTIRQMASEGTEVATAVFLTPAFDKGDTRATAQFGDLYIESSNP